MGKLNFKTSFSTGVSVTAGIIANLYVLFLQAGSLTNLATLSGWKVGIGVAAIGIIGTAIYRAIKVRKLSLGLAKDLQTEAMDNL